MLMLTKMPFSYCVYVKCNTNDFIQSIHHVCGDNSINRSYAFNADFVFFFLRNEWMNETISCFFSCFFLVCRVAEEFVSYLCKITEFLLSHDWVILLKLF